MASYLGQYKCQYKPDKALVDAVQKQAVVEQSVSFVDIPLIKATSESLSGYGRLINSRRQFYDEHVQLVQWPSPSGRLVFDGVGGGATAPSKFTCAWSPADLSVDEPGCVRSAVCRRLHEAGFAFDECTVSNEGVDGRYVVGARIHGGGGCVLSDANAHPDGEQHFWPVCNGPFVLVLSKHADEATLSPLHFAAFYFDGACGLVLNAGVYHQAAFPAGGRADAHLLTKQGKIHGNVIMDSLSEFGVLMRIKGCDKRPSTDVLPAHLHTAAADASAAHGHEHGAAHAGYHVLDTHVPRLLRSFARQVHTVPAADELLRPYGIDIVQSPAEKVDLFAVSIEQWPARARPMYLGNEAGARRQCLDIHWDGRQQVLVRARSNCVGEGATGTCYTDGSIRVNKLYRRMDSSLLMWSANGRPWLMAIAHSEPPFHLPIGRTLAAVSVPAGVGLHVPATVWHGPPVPWPPAHGDAEALVMQQLVGNVDAIEIIDLVHECGATVDVVPPVRQASGDSATSD